MTRISYQLYCSRNNPSMAETLKMVAEAGYKEVEGYRVLFEDMGNTHQMLDENGLRMTSAHIGLDMMEEDPAGVLDIAKSFGIEKVFGPYVPPEERPSTTAEWTAFAKHLHALGAPLRDAGVQFGWHNHDFEFDVTPEGDLPIDLIVATAPDMMLELDLGWVRAAGHDTVAMINKFAGKIAAVHVKDIAPDGECTDEDGWADVGHGIMDWAAIHAALQAAGVDHYVAEHDNPSDDKRFATRSFALFRNSKDKS